MQEFKKWLPFGIILTCTCISFLYLLFSGGSDPYIPQTNNPETIYKDACAHCHGLNGQGDGFLYPAFDNEKLTIQKISTTISEGSWRMPDFKYIRNDTLQNLALYIYEKQYVSNHKK